MPAEMVGENLFAFSNDRFFAHPFKAEPVPCVLLTLDNHSRGVLIELVSMYPDPASLGLLENEGERIVKFLVRAKPDKLALAHIHIRLEMLSPSRAHRRVAPVASHHKVVVVLIVFHGSDNTFKAQVNAKLLRAFLQQQKHLLAANPRKAMPPRNRAHTVLHHGDIIPIGKIRADRIGRLRVILPHVREGIV